MTALDVTSVTLAGKFFTPKSPQRVVGRLPYAHAHDPVDVDRVGITCRWYAGSKHRPAGWHVDVWLARKGSAGVRFDTIDPDMRDPETAAYIAALKAEHTPAGRPVITLETAKEASA